MAGHEFTISDALSATAYGRGDTSGINATAWAQAIASTAIPVAGYHYQVAVWFDSEPSTSRLTLGQRSCAVEAFKAALATGAPVPWGAWSTRAAAANLNGATIWSDPHLSPSVGIDRYGYVHVGWCAHGVGDKWQYHVGDVPLNESDTDAIHIDTNGRVSGGEHFSVPDAQGRNVFVDNISYPRFIQYHDGGLQFTGRIGGAGGDAQQLLWELTASADGLGTWAEVQAGFIDFPGSGGDQSSPYVATPYVDSSNVVHWVWTMDRTGTQPGKSGVWYCRSRDRNRTFENGHSAQLSIPVYPNADSLAWDVPELSGLPTYWGVTANGRGEPLIGGFWTDTLTAGTGCTYYVLTARGGVWHRSEVFKISETWNLVDVADLGYPEAARPELFHHDGTTWFVYRSNFEPGATSNGFPTWRVRSATGDISSATQWSSAAHLFDWPIADSQPQFDKHAWARHGRCFAYLQIIDASPDDRYGNNQNRSNYVAESLEVIAPMGTVSTAARTALVNHWRNKAAYTPAATHYAHAYAGGVAVSESPVAYDNDNVSYDAPASRVVALVGTLDFDDPTTDWGDVDEIRITDNATPGAGLELGRHTLASPVAINTGTGPLQVTGITISAPAGALPDDEIHDLLGLMFGAVANSPRATTWGAYADGPLAGDEISAARVELTQDDVWGDAVNGQSNSIAPVAIADESAATHWLEFDAETAGALVFVAPVPAPPSAGVIPAGALRTRFI